MKTFQQFLEQIETAMQAKELAAKKTMANTKMSAIANMRQRRHVHGELAHMASYELQKRKERNPFT